MPPPVATLTVVGRLQWPERWTARPNGAAATASPANMASTAAIAATSRLVIARLPVRWLFTWLFKAVQRRACRRSFGAFVIMTPREGVREGLPDAHDP
jgi:hypothetical protein